MENLKLANENLVAALERLDEAIAHFENFKKNKNENLLEFMDNDSLGDSLRDSLIQRFEFCVDLFWKYLKKHLEIVVKTPPDINGPGPVIKQACKSKLLSEVDTEFLLEMIKSRNFTSHIYKEEIADQISKSVPGYYKVMKKYAVLK